MYKSFGQGDLRKAVDLAEITYGERVLAALHFTDVNNWDDGIIILGRGDDWVSEVEGWPTFYKANIKFSKTASFGEKETILNILKTKGETFFKGVF